MVDRKEWNKIKKKKRRNSFISVRLQSYKGGSVYISDNKTWKPRSYFRLDPVMQRNHTASSIIPRLIWSFVCMLDGFIAITSFSRSLQAWRYHSNLLNTTRLLCCSHFACQSNRGTTTYSIDATNSDPCGYNQTVLFTLTIKISPYLEKRCDKLDNHRYRPSWLLGSCDILSWN